MAEDRILIIGASSGGPPALYNLIPRFEAAFPYPILVVQHMPPGFTATLAETLDEQSALAVVEARQDDIVKPGRVLVAPSPFDMHLIATENGSAVSCTAAHKNQACSPRIDCTMESAAKIYGPGTVCVVLSGMAEGRDCVAGAAAVRQAGGAVIAQSPETCACPEMPEAVIEAGHSTRQATLEEMHRTILECLGLQSLGQ